MIATAERCKESFPNHKVILISTDMQEIIENLKLIQSGRSKLRFLDILACNGGCISGPAIVNKVLTVKQRKQKISDFISQSQ